MEDRSFRLGGDEFAIIMPSTSVSDAKVLAERIRSAVREELQAAVTLTIGIADTFDGVYEAERLRCNADAALYVGKEHGRDTIIGFDYLMPTSSKNFQLVTSESERPTTTS